jgi:hypothetical protein
VDAPDERQQPEQDEGGRARVDGDAVGEGFGEDRLGDRSGSAAVAG